MSGTREKSATSAIRKLKTKARLKAEVFGVSNSDLQPSAFESRLSRLVRRKKTVDEGVLCELRCRVKIEKRHDLRFMKLDGLR